MIKIDISRGWLPDLAPFEVPEGGLIRFENYIPTSEMALPFRDPVAYSTAESGTSSNASIGDVPIGDVPLADGGKAGAAGGANTVSGTPLSAVEFLDEGDVYRMFIGTSTKLYRLEPDKSLTDITKAATAYTGAANNWSFAAYEQNIIATNYSDAPQILTAMNGANFADLGGSPPKAKYCIVNNGHLIFANLNESGTVKQNKALWSAREDFDNFTPSLTTGAGSQVFYASPSPITGMVNISRDSFLIFHESSMTYGYYVGSGYAFGFEENRFKNVGAIPGTMIVIGGACYFWDKANIYVTDGNSLVPIGNGVKNNILQTLKKGVEYRITATSDPFYPIIYWNVISIAQTEELPDKTFAYNYEAKKWAVINQNVHCMFVFHAAAPDPDEMDNLLIDSIPIKSDSREWTESTEKLACITSDGSICTYDGEAKTGVIETGEYSDGSVIMITRVRPKVQYAITSPVVNVGSRMTEGSTVSYSTDRSVASNGYANVRATGMFHRIRITTSNHSGVPNMFTAEGVKVGEK